MARSRMVRPEFFNDEKLSTISRDARLLFIGLWVEADDFGVVKGNPTWLKARIFPYESLTIEKISGWLTELEQIRCILKFTANDELFYLIRTFSLYQIINRPSKFRNAVPPDDLSTSSAVSTHTQLTEGSLNTHGGLTPNKKQKQKQNKNSEHDMSPPGLILTLGSFENVKLSEDELAKLKAQFGEIDTIDKIERLSQYIASKGAKYKSHYATILSWERRRLSAPPPPNVIAINQGFNQPSGPTYEDWTGKGSEKREFVKPPNGITVPPE